MFFSESIKGFIPDQYKEDGTYSEATWPSDAVQLTEDEVSEFVGTPSPAGKILGSSGGRPAWVDYVSTAPSVPWDKARARAYRYESDPLFMAWQYDKTPESEAAWRESVKDIKARYPKDKNE